MSVLKGEGKVPILFGSTSIAAGSVIHGGYLARPDLAGEWPTILVMSSAWGVTSSTKDICRRLARQGFAAVAPDLYVGAAPSRSAPLELAERVAAHVSGRRTGAIIEDIVEFVQNPAGYWSNAERGYGILSVGSGARPAIAAATSADVASLAMVSPSLVIPALYEESVPVDTTDSLSAVTAPILAISGGSDDANSADRVERSRAAAPHAEWIVYDGLGADFVDDYSDGFDQPAFADAMDRLNAFFEKTLPEA